MNTVGDPFFTPFLQGTFFRTIFAPPKKQKKRSLTEFRRKFDENVGLKFLFGSFFDKGEKYLLIFACTFKFFSCRHFVNNQSLFVVITTGFDIYYIIFRFESGDFVVQRKIQFGYILETFENFNKRKTLVGPQVIPRSLALPNEAKWLQKSDVLLWKT